MVTSDASGMSEVLEKMLASLDFENVVKLYNTCRKKIKKFDGIVVNFRNSRGIGEHLRAS